MDNSGLVSPCCCGICWSSDYRLNSLALLLMKTWIPNYENPVLVAMTLVGFPLCCFGSSVQFYGFNKCHPFMNVACFLTLFLDKNCRVICQKVDPGSTGSTCCSTALSHHVGRHSAQRQNQMITFQSSKSNHDYHEVSLHQLSKEAVWGNTQRAKMKWF